MSCVRQRLGEQGEAVAARELERLGYDLVERRWSCRFGEIDLVAWDGETLVIVEVKTRSRDDYGAPVNAVDFRKQQRLVRLAQAYLQARGLRDVNVRFDVVGIHDRGDGDPEVTLIEGAFQAL